MSLLLLRVGFALAGGLVAYFLTTRHMRTVYNEFSNRVTNIDSSRNLCAVCYTPIKDSRSKTLQCHHKFHVACINEVWKDMEKEDETCPACWRYPSESNKVE